MTLIAYFLERVSSSSAVRSVEASLITVIWHGLIYRAQRALHVDSLIKAWNKHLRLHNRFSLGNDSVLMLFKQTVSSPRDSTILILDLPSLSIENSTRKGDTNSGSHVPQHNVHSRNHMQIVNRALLYRQGSLETSSSSAPVL